MLANEASFVSKPAPTGGHAAAVWDNRICIHRAFNDHDGFRREMYRTTVMGETPV